MVGRGRAHVTCPATNYLGSHADNLNGNDTADNPRTLSLADYVLSDFGWLAVRSHMAH